MLNSNVLDTLKIENHCINLKAFHVDRLFETYAYLNKPANKDSINLIYSSFEKNYEWAS